MPGGKGCEPGAGQDCGKGCAGAAMIGAETAMAPVPAAGCAAGGVEKAVTSAPIRKSSGRPTSNVAAQTLTPRRTEKGSEELASDGASGFKASTMIPRMTASSAPS